MNGKFQKAFGLLELVITTGIVTVALLAFANAAVTFLRASIISSDPHVAAELAQEAIEVVRALRDESWVTEIVPLVNGTTYYPVAGGSKWTLSTTNPGPLKGKYTRFVVLSAVNRDGGGVGDILVGGGGGLDVKTRRVVATVQWVDERGVTRNYSITTYITNFLNN